MAQSGDTDFRPNAAWFNDALRNPKVGNLVDEAAGRSLNAAKANAPVDSGDYKRGLHLEHHEAKYRRVTRVVGDDPKTLLIEAKTGNLARSVKAAKK